MNKHRRLSRSALIVASAAGVIVAALPGRAQTPAPAPAAVASPATLATPPAAVAPAPKCIVPADQARFDYPLPRTARRIAAGLPVKIVAIGSSSTWGAGASSAAASYPSRLAIELDKQFPGHDFTVLNRGVNGEEAADMLARFETSVIAEQPHLVLWQVGTNAVLRDNPLEPNISLLHAGVARLGYGCGYHRVSQRCRYRADRSAVRSEGDRQSQGARHGGADR